MLALSPSATSRTRSNLIVSPGVPSSRSTANSLPSSTRYCFPPVSMTAYMTLRKARLMGEWTSFGGALGANEKDTTSAQREPIGAQAPGRHQRFVGAGQERAATACGRVAEMKVPVATRHIVTYLHPRSRSDYRLTVMKLDPRMTHY